MLYIYIIKNVKFNALYLNQTHKQNNYYAFENDFRTVSFLFQNNIPFFKKYMEKVGVYKEIHIWPCYKHIWLEATNCIFKIPALT